MSRRRTRLVALHRNVQRLIAPLSILNPFARGLTFPHGSSRARRDHEKYLTLIDAIALAHQHARPPREIEGEPCAEITADDVRLANSLSRELFGHSTDELAPHTRRFLEALFAGVEEDRAKTGKERGDYR